MLILVLSLGLTATVIVKMGYRRGSDATALGSMSQSWVAAHNASQPASAQ